jgi:hypothetical protein
MPRKPVLGAVVIATALLMGSPAPVFTGFVIQAAQAKDFYTRKRVNGQWITGKFFYRERERVADATAEIQHPIPPSRPDAAEASDTAETPETPDDYMNRLRVALEAHAKEMLSPLPATPETIVVDGISGIKTTFFSDGSVREELLEPTKTGSVFPAF